MRVDRYPTSRREGWPQPTAADAQSTNINVTLTDDRPLRNWIRCDGQQEALVIESTAAISLPVTVVITTGG